MRRMKEIKDTISKGMTWLKSKYADKTKWIIKDKEGTTYDNYTPK